ncbi:MAG: hypothetical protein K6T91_03550 [Firmicutes bacterium]|nr:hypothetical protein [Bacillota bacterium]
MNSVWRRLKYSSRLSKIIMLLAGLVILSLVWELILGLGLIGSRSSEGHSIEYIVTSTANKVSVTYTNEKGWTYQKENVTLPWRWKSPAKAQDGTTLYISAEINQPEGLIEVEIRQDGKTFKKDRRFGPFVVATARGYAGDK